MKRGPLVTEGDGRLGFLTQAPLERLTGCAHACHYTKGTVICAASQFGDAAYFILSGSCELCGPGSDGNQQVLGAFAPGTAFGGLETVEPEHSGTSVVAGSDCFLLRIERRDVEALRAEATGRILNADRPTAPISLTVSPPVTLHSARGKVFTLPFLSDDLPASLITQTLMRWLCAETGASAVLVRLERQPSRGALPAHFLNGEFHMPNRIATNEAGYHYLPVTIGREGASPQGVASLVDRLSSRFEYVLIATCGVERDSDWLTELVLRSNSAYVFLGTTEEDLARLVSVVQGVKARVGSKEHRIKPVACMAEGQTMGDFDSRAERTAMPLHLYVRGCPTVGVGGEIRDSAGPKGSFDADVRRLAREIGGRMVGLALSSGAAKGFSHIGVLQVLEENGIEVDAIAGSSMGAYIGALWAYGLDGREMERLARELEERWALWSLVDPVFLPRQGFLRGLGLKNRLMRTIGHARFGDLSRPLRIVAGNLATLERVVFGSGEVATAVHCSSAIPGICVPITIDGETYVDGAVVDPLPVDVLREMGVSRVIAVDAIPTPDRIRCMIESQREMLQQKDATARARRRFRKGSLLGRAPTQFARGNLLQIVMRSLRGAQIRVAEASCRLADLVLRPNIYDDCWLDCAKPGKFIALGREAAEKQLDDIKKLAGKKEITYEWNSPSDPVATIA